VTRLDFQTRQWLRHQVAAMQRAKHHAYEIELCGGACSECGTPWSTPQPGCKQCGDRVRRKKARQAARDRVGLVQHGQCSGCGTNWDRYTVGCGVCWDRRRRRQQAAA